MAPSRGMAASAAGRTVSKPHADFPAVIRQLQAGLPLLRKPYSEAGADAVARVITCPILFRTLANIESEQQYNQLPPGDHQQTSDASQVLQLLNQYLKWLSACLKNEPYSSSSSSSRSSSRGGRNTKARTAAGSSAQTGALCFCFMYIGSVIPACCAAKASSQQATAALLPHLVAPNTGTISLLTQAAGALGYPLPQGGPYKDLYWTMLRTWMAASHVVYPLDPPETNSSSNSSTNSATTGSSSGSATSDDNSSSSSSSSSSSEDSRTTWIQVPALMEGLPAMAQLLHGYLQQPPSSWSGLGRGKEGHYLERLVMQCGLMLGDVTVARWGLERAEPQQQQPLCSVPYGQGVCLSIPEPARQKVERFLWHALPTAAVALQRAAEQISAERGGSTTSGGYSRFPLLPNGSGYNLQLGSDGAASIIEIIAPILLQLASGDVREQQQLDLVAAGTWLRLRGRDMTAEEEEEGVVVLQQDGDSTEQQQTSAGVAQAGFLWWSSTQVQAHSSSTVSSTTTTSSSSSASAIGAVTSAALQSNRATTHSEAPPAAHSRSSSSSSRSSSSRRRGAQAAKHVHPSAAGAGAAGPHPTHDRAPGGVQADDPSASAGTKLHALAAAAAVQLLVVQDYSPAPKGRGGSVQDSAYRGACKTMSQLLLLLVQQLQAVAAQERTAFLHSPAGILLLQVFGDLLCEEGISMNVADVTAGRGPQAPAGSHHHQQQQQQQQQQMAADLQVFSISGLTLIEQLLLPGLLLQPAAGVCEGDAGGDSSTRNSPSATAATRSSRSTNTNTCSSSSSSNRSSTSTSSSHSSEGPECMSKPNAGGISAASSSSSHVVMTLGKGVLAPLVVLPPSALQLPPGRPPPPAAFFLVEDLLGRAPTVNTFTLAVQLLQGSVGMATKATACQQQQQQQAEEGSGQQLAAGPAPGYEQAAAGSELYELAYCSLACTVVLAMVCCPQLGEDCMRLMLALAGQLAQAAKVVAPCCSSSSSSSSTAAATKSSSTTAAGFNNTSNSSGCGHGSSSAGGSGSSSGGSSSTRGAAPIRRLFEARSVSDEPKAANKSSHDDLRLTTAVAKVVAAGKRLFGGRGSRPKSTDASAASSSTTTTTSSCSSRRSRVSRVNLAASLAAAAAASAYTAHLGTPAMQEGLAQGAASDSCVTADAPGASSISAGEAADSSAAAAGTGSATVGCQGAGSCPSNCSACCQAARVFITLRCLECGAAFPTGPSGSYGENVFPARQQGLTLQQYLQQQLLALAWRHPVPYVCGNVLCGRVEGVSGVGEVRGCVGTLCGRCRAAWYCCEGCQRVAWAEHMKACKNSK